MKVLITTLGANFYKYANYHYENKFAKRTRLGFKASSTATRTDR